MSGTGAVAERMEPRLKQHYLREVVPQLKEKFGYKNDLAVPKLEKIVVGVGLSEARENVKVVDQASEEIAAITGQKPVVTRAKRSISNFKVRQGMPIGIKVTLRRWRMYEFFDRLVTMAIPRIRDFRGLEDGAFDGHGNYNLGLTEQHIFLEIDLEKSEKIRGMNITIATTAKTDDEARTLLEHLGFPFKKRKK
ncbi:MAG: 50S ribosomal protein L5 [Elusimicrobia bacterium RIFCSPLOWO2_01_FULL_64_13]|nr:MAG: 50S ribosomal protein L5 [Elusimicrobia bacterium RIFCSPHIGHO2_01_FULL_64_10]OGR95416.1 MAG: 50S ribosomal protein L5 [Elusimicrobia bacterium RIFCSPLOWO2_01_FULL_64_13]